MDRLSASDASFLFLETPDTPMHVASVILFEPPADGGKGAYQRFREHIASRLHQLAFFQRRLNIQPVMLDNPVWVQEPAVDLDYHIRHVALPKPGTMEQLRTMVCGLHMILLDRARPLWQFHFIEGLEGGRFAVYAKIHHATIDGGASRAAMAVIFSHTPDPEPVRRPPRSSQTTAQEPNMIELMSNAYSEFYLQQMRMFQALPDMGRAAAAVWRRSVEDFSKQHMPLRMAPKSIFNVAVSKHRSFGTASVPLAEARAIAKTTGTKLNDVVMAVCAGTLRRYLEGRKALPGEPLIAGIPVSLREAGNSDMNNQVTMMMSSLATDIADPMQRLAAIAESSRDAKGRLGDVRDAMPKDIAMLGQPMIMSGLAQWAERTKIADQLPAMANVVISNVPGPAEPLYCAGAKCVGYYPVSIPSQGLALNLTVQSYVDSLDFGLIACKVTVPDIQRMADMLVEEFDALRRATGVPATTKPAVAAKASARRASKPIKAAAAASKMARRKSAPAVSRKKAAKPVRKSGRK
jgi:WS/DGAT/MGAT family acyltransferase